MKTYRVWAFGFGVLVNALDEKEAKDKAKKYLRSHENKQATDDDIDRVEDLSDA